MVRSALCRFSSSEPRSAASPLRCLANGREVRGDLLIGADGIHSVVRKYVAGPDWPLYSGQVSWRGLAPAAVARDAGLEVRHHSFWGPRQQLVCFYVSGERLVNWVRNTEGEGEWREESWSARGDREEVLALQRGLAFYCAGADRGH